MLVPIIGMKSGSLESLTLRATLTKQERMIFSMAKSIVISPDDLPQALEIFWARVCKTNNCWQWGKSHFYGTFTYNGKEYQATRWIWTALNGPIPDGLFVCHKCDNPPCVRPDHLFLGTNSDNMKDCVRKGRNGFQRYPYFQVYGEFHGNSILTDEIVLQIRELRKTLPAGEIAKQLNIKRDHVRAICSGNHWKHLPAHAEYPRLSSKTMKTNKTEIEILRIRWRRWLGNITKVDKCDWLMLLESTWLAWLDIVFSKTQTNHYPLNDQPTRERIKAIYAHAIDIATLDDLTHLDCLFVEDHLEKERRWQKARWQREKHRATAQPATLGRAQEEGE